MITLVEALNYRCLKYARQTLKPFQVLVGPNATGKTTFLDVISFSWRFGFARHRVRYKSTSEYPLGLDLVENRNSLLNSPLKR